MGHDDSLQEVIEETPLLTSIEADTNCCDGDEDDRLQQHGRAGPKNDIVDDSLLRRKIVRRRLSWCIFLYTVGTSVMAQVQPKIILEHFDGDDSKASKFHGWLTAFVSVVQFFFVPALSGMSDKVGRRAVIGAALVLNTAMVFILAASHGTLVSLMVYHVTYGLCTVVIPVSQAIMIDVAADGSAAAGDNAAHGLGLAFAAFGFATGVGDIIGGALSENNKTLACISCGIFMLSALFSLRVFSWDETAPRVLFNMTYKPRHSSRVESEGGIQGDGETEDVDRSWQRLTGSTKLLASRISILKIFVESRLLLQIAFCYFCFVVSLNVFATGYNYLDFRFDWSPLQISLFFASFNISMALAAGWGIRRLVPHRLSQASGALFGTLLQACAGAVYGLCFRGWMLFPAVAFGALQNVTEPCLQAIMAKFVTDDRQGSLQGAVMSLRVLAEGTAALMFVQVFSAGSSVGFEQAPFFLAAGVSLTALASAWWPLRKLAHAQPKISSATPRNTLENAEAAADSDEFCVDWGAGAGGTGEGGEGGAGGAGAIVVVRRHSESGELSNADEGHSENVQGSSTNFIETDDGAHVSAPAPAATVDSVHDTANKSGTMETALDVEVVAAASEALASLTFAGSEPGSGDELTQPLLAPLSSPYN